MQDGSKQKGQGILIATNSFSIEECKLLANILKYKYGLITSVVKSGGRSHLNQYQISIWKKSMPILINIVEPYFIPEMFYKIKD
jgi:hypothetical protein